MIQKYIYTGLGIIILTLSVTAGYLSWRLDSVKLQLAQSKTAYNQCVQSQQAAQEASNEYQKQISTLNSRLRDVRRMLDNTIVPIKTTPGGHNGSTTTGEFRGANGVPASELLDIAEDAERVRLRLIGCQNYLENISN